MKTAIPSSRHQKAESMNSKKYEQILKLDLAGLGDNPAKLKHQRTPTHIPFGPDFLEKVMRIKNSKMAPTLQITTDRPLRDTFRGSNPNSDFYNTRENSLASLTARNHLQSRSNATTSFAKPTMTITDNLFVNKTPITTEFKLDLPPNISTHSTRNKLEPMRTTSTEPFMPHSPALLKSGIKMTDVYDNLADVTQQITSIIDSKHDEKIQAFLTNNNWRQILDLQRNRIENIISILERRPQTGLSNSTNKIQSDFNNILKAELSRIGQAYEVTVVHMLHLLTSKNKGSDKPTKEVMDVCGALRALIEYCHFYRVEGITKEGFDKGQRIVEIMESIHEFKLQAKLQKNADLKFLETFEDLENIIKDLNATITRHKFNYEKLAEENKKLLENSRKEINQFREENLTYIKNHFENKKNETTVQDQSLPIFKEKHYTMRIAELENKIKEYHEKFKHYEEKYKRVKYELAILQKNPDNQKKKTVDVAVEVNLYSEKRETVKPMSLKQWVHFKGATTGGMQTLIWVNNAVSMIYNDKLITDLCDDYEKRPRMLLKDYITEWFLKRFGLYSVSELLIKDFIYNVKRYAPEHDRYWQFCALVGIEYSVPKVASDQPQQQQQSKKVDEAEAKSATLNRFKECYYQSIEAQQLYFKLCFYIKQSANPGFLNGPFVPSLDASGSDIIPIEFAKTAMIQLATDEKYDADKIKRLEEKFNEKLGTDLYNRIADEKIEIEGQQNHREGEDKYVRFDFIVRFIMEHFMDSRAQDLDMFITAMKLNQMNKAETNLSIDEFQSCCQTKFLKIDDMKSQVWQEHAFTDLLDEPNADKINFDRLVHKLIPAITDQYHAKEFYLKVPGATGTTKDSGIKEKKFMATKDQLKLISLQISSRFNPKLFNRPGAFVTGSLLNTVVTIYDCVSSILLLFESYEIFKTKIEAVQEKVEQLEFMHEEFKEDLGRLPQGLQNMTKYDIFQQYNMADLVVYIEGCWKKFRVILGLYIRMAST
mgnify:FL=1